MYLPVDECARAVTAATCQTELSVLIPAKDVSDTRAVFEVLGSSC